MSRRKLNIRFAETYNDACDTAAIVEGAATKGVQLVYHTPAVLAAKLADLVGFASR